MLDRIYNFFDDCASSGIDTLLGSAACECSKECLLTPDSLFPSTLVADVVAHRQEQRVSLVVTAAQAKQEGSENTIRNQLRDCVCDVCSTDLSRRVASVMSQSGEHTVRTGRLECRPKMMEDCAAPEPDPHEEGVPGGV